jgi:hypothetical protein
VFTIDNSQTWSGREGDPRPDWFGWGAETFAIAPDSTVWIADSAVSPTRLLHVSPHGDLLQTISLADYVVFPYDLAVSLDGLWVLDIGSDPAKIVNLGTDGSMESSIDVPREIMEYDGQVVANGAFSLWIGENDELYLGALNGFYEIFDASGQFVAQPIKRLPYYGHTFEAGRYSEASGATPALIDDLQLGTPPGSVVGPDAFLGFRSDGSLALAYSVQTDGDQNDYLVANYASSGELQGLARQWPQTFYKDFNHHLFLAPDGSVYQLVSNLDHSVQLVRLGFSVDLPARTMSPAFSPTPLTALPLSSETATAEGKAQNALLAFFADLHAGRYDEAVGHFGGAVDEYMRAPMTGESVAEYWQHLCEYLWCLPIAGITEVRQTSADEYIFYAVFMQDDGTRFEIGACCGGDPAANLPIWQFAYPVRLVEGEWKVMRGPLFTP